MKNLSFFLLFFISACGDSQAPQAVAKTDPAVTPNPTPEIVEPLNPIIGNWIDENKNSLVFKEDHTVLVNESSMEWETENNYLKFKSGELQVDLCSYDISVEGHLNDPMVIVLKLICAESGELNYKKQL